MGRGPTINRRRWWPWKTAAQPPAYEDPLTAYGRLAGGGRVSPPEAPRTRSLWARIFHAGHDAGFVYYDD